MSVKSRAILALACIVALALPALATAISVEETDLAATGTAYEANRDGAGHVIVSDYDAGEIWHVNAASGSFTKFTGLGPVVDGRADAQGNIWWTDSATILGRINTGANPVTVTTWDFLSWDPLLDYSLNGLAFDGSGRVWITEWFGSASQLYRFDPATGELCGYDVPGGSYSYYVLFHDNTPWLINWNNDRMAQLDPVAGTVRRWQLAAGAAEGLVLDTSGNVWWADASSGRLGRLEPGLNRVTTFALPTGTTPHMLGVEGGKIWYTEFPETGATGTVGVLDPAVATGNSTTVTPTTSSVPVTCKPLGTGTTTGATASSGSIAWTGTTWTVLVDAGGWTVYGLPTGSQPWGLTLEGNSTWVADQGRQKLARTTSSGQLAAPAVTIAASGNDAVLAWDAVSGAQGYEVWRSLEPYFTPEGPGSELVAETAGTSWTDSGALATAASEFYQVRAVAEGQVSPASIEVGAFTFGLVPGSGR